MKDGGPAFPTEIKIAQKVTREEREVLNGIVNTISMPGMSLRDYFAVHASEEDIKAVMFGFSDMSRSKARYIFADAMIAERRV